MRALWDCDKSDSNVIAMVFCSYWIGLLGDCDALVVELWEVEGWRMTKEKNLLRREEMDRDMGGKRALVFRLEKSRHTR